MTLVDVLTDEQKYMFEDLGLRGDVSSRDFLLQLVTIAYEQRKQIIELQKALGEKGPKKNG